MNAPTIDVGPRFPLRYSFRPGMDGLVYALMLVALFLVLPIAYWIDERPAISRAWPLVVASLLGVLGLVWAVACVRVRVGWVVDETHVQMSSRGLIATQTSRIPRSEYVAIVTPNGLQPGFIGERTRYQIVLWHPDDPMKQIVLYAGPNERLYQERLETYRVLLALPVNPPGLDLIEIPG